MFNKGANRRLGRAQLILALTRDFVASCALAQLSPTFYLTGLHCLHITHATCQNRRGNKVVKGKVIRTACVAINRTLLVNWMLGINPLRGLDKGRGREGTGGLMNERKAVPVQTVLWMHGYMHTYMYIIYRTGCPMKW